LPPFSQNADESLEAPALALHAGLPNSSLGNDDCIDIGLPKSEIAVRDAKASEADMPRSAKDKWQAFLGGIANDGFDHLSSKRAYVLNVQTA
jgi:hypothetical protein